MATILELRHAIKKSPQNRVVKECSKYNVHQYKMERKIYKNEEAFLYVSNRILKTCIWYLHYLMKN